jgi:diguanylate cyclase (GGDEF)-like protein/PAS domain S-box-containing protein
MLRNVLLISTVPERAAWLEACIGGAHDGPFTVSAAGSCTAGLAVLSGQDGAAIAAVFVELTALDDTGAEALQRALNASTRVPLIILCEAAEEERALRAIQHGAQDYVLTDVLTGQPDAHAVVKALRGAVARAQYAEPLHRERESARLTLQSMGDAVISSDSAGAVTYLNPVAERMTGWSLREACGLPVPMVLRITDGDTHEAVADPLEMAMLYNSPLVLGDNAVLTDRLGNESFIEDTSSPIHDAHGRVVGGVIVFHDVSRTRAMIRRISHLAHHDYLTDLPNRVLLGDRLDRGIESVLRHGKLLAVLFLDVDHFKEINDRLGHAVGDALLQSVSRQLEDCVRGTDTVSRHGGDEFVILLSDISRARDIVVLAEKILHAIAQPRQLAGEQVSITASIGIAVFPQDGTSSDALLRNADAALLAAKAHGRGKYAFHAPVVEARTLEVRALRGG